MEKAAAAAATIRILILAPFCDSAPLDRLAGADELPDPAAALVETEQAYVTPALQASGGRWRIHRLASSLTPVVTGRPAWTASGSGRPAASTFSNRIASPVRPLRVSPLLRNRVSPPWKSWLR